MIIFWYWEVLWPFYIFRQTHFDVSFLWAQEHQLWHSRTWFLNMIQNCSLQCTSIWSVPHKALHMTISVQTSWTFLFLVRISMIFPYLDLVNSPLLKNNVIKSSNSVKSWRRRRSLSFILPKPCFNRDFVSVWNRAFSWFKIIIESHNWFLATFKSRSIEREDIHKVVIW